MVKEVAAGFIGLGAGIGLSYAFLQKFYNNYQMKPDKYALAYARGVENLDGHAIYKAFAEGALQSNEAGVTPEQAIVKHWEKVKSQISVTSARIVTGYKMKGMSVWIISVRFAEAGQKGEMIMEIVSLNDQGIAAVRTIP